MTKVNIESLVKRIGTEEIICNLNFCAKKGDIVKVSSKKNSGKTTFLKIIAGIYLPSSGKVSVNGRSIYVPSSLNFGINDRLSARKNLYLIGSLLGISRENISLEEEEIFRLAKINNPDLPLMYFTQKTITSFGKYASFKFVLLLKPKIILFDDLSSSVLDTELVKELIKISDISFIVSQNEKLLSNLCNVSLEIN